MSCSMLAAVMLMGRACPLIPIVICNRCPIKSVSESAEAGILFIAQFHSACEPFSSRLVCDPFLFLLCRLDTSLVNMSPLMTQNNCAAINGQSHSDLMPFKMVLASEARLLHVLIFPVEISAKDSPPNPILDLSAAQFLLSDSPLCL